MPPLTVTSKTLEPIVLAPSVHDHHDAWIEKVFGPRDRQANAADKRRYLESERCKAVCAGSSSEDDGDEAQSYREELEKYIAEATANLRNEEPLDDPDDELVSPCSDIFTAECKDTYVEPPVEVPRSYRTQDLQGGMVVGGDCVLFTDWAFKRQLRCMRRLRPIPERRDAGENLLSDEDGNAKGVYSGKIVEL